MSDNLTRDVWEVDEETQTVKQVNIALGREMNVWNDHVEDLFGTGPMWYYAETEAAAWQAWELKVKGQIEDLEKLLCKITHRRDT